MLIVFPLGLLATSFFFDLAYLATDRSELAIVASWMIFAGVIGGLFGFGLVGIFVGPVMLAVSYTLIEAWLNDADYDPPAVPGVPAVPAANPAGKP